MKKNRTLIIDRFSSTCGNCDRGCSPDEKQHDTNLGYGITDKTRKGCGVEWAFVTTAEYVPSKHLEDAVRKMRPDLIYIEGLEMGI